ncbi:MAG: 16S rRNA (uracil(1498)-N(3))-methyltransferase [Candidatus Marinimicrobia bacterium]|nr:16S rRNA (uracil(1498)-N(3))-methyltransferase [Candidatus Neomarinimicrobiota bacterium]
MSPDHAFFIEPNSVTGQSFILDKEESHHASHVLRMKAGTVIRLLDGTGNGYTAEIKKLGTHVSGHIIETIPQLGENTTPIHLALGLIKRDRFELTLEKATELGVQSITPLILDRCIKRSVNLERSRKQIIAASKQCQRSYFPAVHQPISLNEWINSTTNEIRIGCFIGSETPISNVAKMFPSKPLHIIIGPEGDFSEPELKLLIENQIVPVNLGPRRLRAETAVMAALAVLNETTN